MEGSELVKLKVKSPSSTIADIELEVGLNTSVRQLKGLITERYPGNPQPSVSTDTGNTKNICLIFPPPGTETSLCWEASHRRGDFGEVPQV